MCVLYFRRRQVFFFFFFLNDTATTEIYTLPLHDALPIYQNGATADGAPDILGQPVRSDRGERDGIQFLPGGPVVQRSEEHTSELQSLAYLVCRLLLEKKKKPTSYLYLRHTAKEQLNEQPE